jgi:TetR/AcrR family transcriptional repressor of mexJK operon
MTALIFNSDSIRLHRIIQAEAARHPNLAKIFYEAGPKRVRTAFADLLRAWNKQGRLSVPNATKATEQFFSLLKGELLMKHIMLMEPLPGPQEIKKHVRATVRLFIAAHRAAPPSKIKSKKDMS